IGKGSRNEKNHMCRLRLRTGCGDDQGQSRRQVGGSLLRGVRRRLEGGGSIGFRCLRQQGIANATERASVKRRLSPYARRNNRRGIIIALRKELKKKIGKIEKKYSS